MDFEIKNNKYKTLRPKPKKTIYFAAGALTLLGLLSLFLVFLNNENNLQTQNDQINSSTVSDQNKNNVDSAADLRTNQNDGENNNLASTDAWIPRRKGGAYIISDSQKLKMPSAINLDEYRVENQNFTIIIPALNLEALIVSDIPNFKTANPNETEGEFGDRIQAALEKGTLHYPDSSLPSDTYRGFNRNTVILGHSASNDFGPESYKDIFSDLQELELGNLIIIHYQGVEYTYKVYDKQITDPTAVEILRPGETDNNLTVITCHPPGNSRHRLVILALQISPQLDDNQQGSIWTDLPEINAPAGLKEIPIDF